MFDDELTIMCVRAQTTRLKEILAEIENDEKWKEHALYYAEAMHGVEKNLRNIRKTGFEAMSQC